MAKVVMLDTVEDTNGAVDADTGGISFRTDVLRKGDTHDLPDDQAARLVKIKLAKAAK